MRHFESSAHHALPLDDRLFQEPLYVTHAGWERVSPNQSYPRPGHASCYGFTWEEGRVMGEFCLWLMMSGQGEVETDLGRQPIRAGQACLYRPGEWHRHRPIPNMGWFILWINFNGNLPHQWMENRSFRLEKNRVQVADRRLFEAQFRRLVAAVDELGAHNSLQFSWQTIGLLSHFLRDSGAGDRSPTAASGDSLADKVMDYIWSQSHNPIGVPDLVRFTGINRRTLERRFKAATGASLLGEIQRCRISRAALLLRETKEPIKYVMGRAGFTSYQALRLAFQNQFGLSPENYRLREQHA
jgi:AraC-like DNA-binding protein